MKVVGLIAEYNPLHDGHLYQLQKIRQLSRCDVLLVAMSGNIVQRGQFAVLDKWTRANLALAAGADLVFELPLLASLQSADYFAKYSVQLLAKLGCQSFYFGTEEASLEDLEAIVQAWTSHKDALDKSLHGYLKHGYSYAAAFQKAVDDLLSDLHVNTRLPNHLLGLQYLSVNQQLINPMKAQVIRRISDDTRLMNASAIRKAMDSLKELEHKIPPLTYQALGSHPQVDQEDYWPALKHMLMTMTPETLQHIQGMKEGIEHTILKAAKQADSWTGMCHLLISKRWTRASINRLLLNVLGKITKEEWQSYTNLYEKEPTVRLLGFKPMGKEYLKRIRYQKDLKIISNWSRNLVEKLFLVERMDLIYTYHSKSKIREQNILPKPIFYQ